MLSAIADLFRSKVLSIFFFVSGFCALLYQLIYLRLAFSAFGVVTPVVSVVLSLFMFGFGVGGWLGGRYIDSIRRKTGVSAIIWYGIAEILIGVGAFAVPASFAIGRSILLSAGQASSIQYLSWSGAILSISLLPWTLIMGTTFVFGMAFLREFPETENRTFGLLYVANVIGAVLGTVTTGFVLIEVFGFKHALMIAAALNFLIGSSAVAWGVGRRGRAIISSLESTSHEKIPNESNPSFYWILFLTGFATMAMEVLWTRAFAKVLGPFVYSFALLLTVYLSSTAAGSLVYRRDVAKKSIRDKNQLMGLCAISAFLPIVMTDPRLHAIPMIPEVLASIMPFSALVGYMTPMIIDELSRGDEEKAGKAYAVNIVGCVLGPLVAGYFLLPVFGAKQSLIYLALPFTVTIIYGLLKDAKNVGKIAAVCVSAVLFLASLFCQSWEDDSSIPSAERGLNPLVFRDHVATTIAYGDGAKKNLLVNGSSMTTLEPSTKVMVHLPLAMRGKPPKSILVICFGMGTSFRAALSWDVPVTVVDLVPGVPRAFPYFWSDAPAVLNNPNGRVVVDDGRRFLARTEEKFDLITVDPPQPLAVAGSSLLYSREFYQLVKKHLTNDGIMQEYMPNKDLFVMSAVVRSMQQSFKYVKIYELLGKWGYHLIASNQPLPDMTPDQVIHSLPSKALVDFQELDPGQDKLADLKRDLNTILHQETSLPEVLAKSPDTAILEDDRPLNEYFLLRNAFGFGKKVH